MYDLGLFLFLGCPLRHISMTKSVEELGLVRRTLTYLEIVILLLPCRARYLEVLILVQLCTARYQEVVTLVWLCKAGYMELVTLV